MVFRNCITATLLFCLFASSVAAQGTPGGKTKILTGFTPLSDKELQEGYVQLFDGISTFGWKGDAKIEDKKLYFTGTFEESPYWFFGGDNRHLTSNTLEGALGILSSFSNGVNKSTMCTRETMVSLFDGKTLTGWTLRGKAEAEVKDGAIRLTNGSGSLESDGKYGDFILQLEYFTPVRPEGKGVNSGVFFRCIPGEVMNGYEC